jgi:DNA-binding MarR family transcriptional regulator
MTDVLSNPSLLFLREPELRRGMELVYFGYRDYTRGADVVLERHGFGRAHHRALYFIARKPGLIVSELLKLLRITKQSLSRVLLDLSERGLIETTVGRVDKRQRQIKLLPAGEALERELFNALKDRMQAAYVEAGPQAVAGFWQVMHGLLEPEERAEIEMFLKGRTQA